MYKQLSEYHHRIIKQYIQITNNNIKKEIRINNMRCVYNNFNKEVLDEKYRYIGYFYKS